jgi:hypothetical protein
VRPGRHRTRPHTGAWSGAADQAARGTAARRARQRGARLRRLPGLLVVRGAPWQHVRGRPVLRRGARRVRARRAVQRQRRQRVAPQHALQHAAAGRHPRTLNPRASCPALHLVASRFGKATRRVPGKLIRHATSRHTAQTSPAAFSAELARQGMGWHDFGRMPVQLGPARGPLPEAARRRRGGPHGRVEQECGERDEHVVALQVLQAHLPGPPALRPGHLTPLQTRTGRGRASGQSGEACWRCAPSGGCFQAYGAIARAPTPGDDAAAHRRAEREPAGTRRGVRGRAGSAHVRVRACSSALRFSSPLSCMRRPR